MRPKLIACLETKEIKLQLLLGQSTVKNKVRRHISSITGIESLNGAKRAVCYEIYAISYIRISEIKSTLSTSFVAIEAVVESLNADVHTVI